MRITLSEGNVIALNASALSVFAANIKPSDGESTFALVQKLTRGIECVYRSITLLVVGKFNTRLVHPTVDRRENIRDTLADFNCWIVTPPTIPTFVGYSVQCALDFFTVNVFQDKATYVGDLAGAH